MRALGSLRIAEPDVTLTDYGLALESAWFAFRLSRRPLGPAPLKRWWSLFFAATSAGSLTGGTVHGFFPDERSTGQRVLWPATLFAIGVASWAGWGIAARLLWGQKVARRIEAAAALECACYGALVLLGSRRFALAVANYLPPALLLCLGFSACYARTKEPPALAGASGIVLTFAAAGVQVARIPLHRRYFDHNAFYHLLQAGALALLYSAGQWLVAQEPAR